MLFGVENRLNPTPCSIIDMNIIYNGVVSSKKHSITSAIDTIIIPIAASICGLILSDSLPAIGAPIAMISGVTISISPVVSGLNPFKYCRW